MNYLKIYEDICELGKYDRSLEYAETHHIIPKCMEGTDEQCNLTNLSAREHYIVHYILTKIYKNNSSICYAFGMMKNKNKFQERLFTSKQYETMKKSYSTAMKLNNPMYNEETIKRAMQTRKDRYTSGENIQRKLSKEEKVAISERMSGNNNPTRRFPEKHNFANNKYVEGKHCYHNGIINKYFNPDDIIPEGFARGNKPRVKRKIITN